VLVVSREELTSAFDDLLSGRRTREQVSSWAEALRVAHDADKLAFEPASAKPVIWEAILYLTGVDLRTSPSEYLHVPADFEEFRQHLGL
jgi:hypothetical protein